MSNITKLFQFGSYNIPLEYIAEAGYDIKPNQRQDLDPFTDETGLTHRNALKHTKTEVNVTLRSNLKWNEIQSVISGITSNYINWAERDANCTYYDPETDSLKTGHMYLESSQPFQIRTVNKRYSDLTLSFVEY